MEAVSNKSFLKYSWFLVGMVFLVILAGGVVRMTQSGMGCPDWPKCFGLWIPPLHESELPADFEKYLSKQDIDHSFNVYHTWIEYINRLLGALLGIFIFINLIWAVRSFWKRDRFIVYTSLILFLLTGFQGWLGKLVVDSNLSVVKITIHMLVAIVIVFLPLINISRLKGKRTPVPQSVVNTLTALLLMLSVQIILGTEVREQIDSISKSLAYEQRELWIERLDILFVVHRSFSWLVVIGIGSLWWFSRGIVSYRPQVIWLVSLMSLTILLGIVMAYMDMPAIAQPAHLVLACALIVSVFYSRLRVNVT